MVDNPANREQTGRFKKGVSGNPSGRKPIPQEFKELAEKHSIPALQQAINIMQDENAKYSDRLKAVEIVLDRGIGKPQQPVDITSDNEPLQVIFNIPRPKKDDDSCQ